MEWDERAQSGFATEVESYMRADGKEPSPAALAGTLRTNTELVPGRAKQLLRFLDELGGVGSIAGLSVLETGSGFGALATYLALTEGPERVTGIDLHPDLIEAAQRAVAGLGVKSLSFSVDDMCDLGSIDDDSFDVAFVNNALLYVTGPGGVSRAVASLARVLRPDGRLVIFQANRWRYTDPFHGTPVVHLLPKPVRRPIDRRLGRPEESDRISLLSPISLRRILRGAGFGEVRYGAIRGNAVDGRRRTRFASWIGVVGRITPTA